MSLSLEKSYINVLQRIEVITKRAEALEKVAASMAEALEEYANGSAVKHPQISQRGRQALQQYQEWKK